MLHLIPWKQRTDKVVQRCTGKLKDEFDALYNRFLNRWMEPVDMESGFRHQFGAFEFEDHDNEFIVHVHVPGFEAKELDVQATENLLTIKAAKNAKNKKNGNGNHEEQTYRTLHRTVSLPNGIDAEAITANYHNGRLDIHLPKRDAIKPKRIAVKT